MTADQTTMTKIVVREGVDRTRLTVVAPGQEGTVELTGPHELRADIVSLYTHFHGQAVPVEVHTLTVERDLPVKLATCRACRAPMRWVVSDKGKRMPLDPDPVVDGNLLLTGEVEYVTDLPVVRYMRRDEAPDVPTYKSHFATCPDAEAFRRRA